MGQGTYTVNENETKTHALQFHQPKPCGKSYRVKNVCFASPPDIGLAPVALIKFVKVALSSGSGYGKKEHLLFQVFLLLCFIQHQISLVFFSKWTAFHLIRSRRIRQIWQNHPYMNRISHKHRTHSSLMVDDSWSRWQLNKWSRFYQRAVSEFFVIFCWIHFIRRELWNKTVSVTDCRRIFRTTFNSYM